jgi:hypothetical protein
MKIVLLLLLLFCSLTLENVNNEEQQELEMTVEEFDKMLMAFLEEIHIDNLSNATIPCKTSFDHLVEEGMDAFTDIKNKKYYDGIIGITDVLGGSSPVARNCTKSIDELIVLYFSYVGSFDSFQVWMDTIVENVRGHMSKLTLLAASLVNELERSHPNYESIGSDIGEMVYLTMKSNTTYPNLKYTKTDPLAPAPLNKYVWVTLESLYEFIAATKIVKENILSD